MTGPREKGDKEEDTWLSAGERGNALGVRALVFLATFGGRRLARLVLYFVAFYFVLFHSKVRRASRSYWQHLEGEDASFGKVYRHVLCFAQVALDRLFFAKRKFGKFHFEHHGHQYLEDVEKSGQGAILLGAHLGSFEAMRALSVKCGLRLNIVGYFKNAKMINHALQKLDPQLNARFLSIDAKNMKSILQIKECIENGELVAILGDRVGLSRNSVRVDFLGQSATLPGGIFLLAHTLKCPVYLTFGLYDAPNTYRLYCEPFAERVLLPRGERQEAIGRYAQEYADRLAYYCKKAPYNWFNFYRFWDAPADGAGRAEEGKALSSGKEVSP